MRRIFLFLSLFLITVPALATGRLADVRITEVATGRPLPVHFSGGRHYIAGTPGAEYRITVRNRSGTELLAVVSVDGVNVVSGETAAVSQGGYVIGRRDSVAIAGWRKSLDHVAAFYFSDADDAYARRTGRPDHVGVIGVALFRRKPEPAVELLQRERRAESGAAADSAERPAAPQAAEKSIGTGHGRHQDAPARYVEFERESDTPNELIVIHYDTHANLVARGVVPPPRVPVPRLPSPFPGGFVADPPDRG